MRNGNIDTSSSLSGTPFFQQTSFIDIKHGGCLIFKDGVQC